jgi:multiple sugar transport system substrate-binding protein
MKKFFITGLLLAVTLASLFAAGQKEKDAAATGPVTINHWYWVPNADIPRYTEMINEFNRTHPNIKVVWENVPQRDVRTKFITAYQVGEGPDTFVMTDNWILEFSTMKMLEPLDTYIAQWLAKDNIIPALWNVTTINGTVWSLPWKLNVLYLYYRADWFKELGLQPPKTWEDFLRTAKGLTGKYKNEEGEEIERYGFGLRGGDGGYDPYFVYVQNNGGKIYNDDGTVAFNSPVAITATQRYLDYFQKDKITPPSAVGDGMAEMIGAFKSGRTAMIIHHIGTSVELSGSLGDKLGVTLIPIEPGVNRWTRGSVINEAISSISKHKKEAFTFISWMSEDWAVEHQGRYLGSVPITKTVSALPYFQNENQFYRVSGEAAVSIGSYPKRITWANIVENVAEKLLQQALMGQITAQQMVSQIAAELNKP